MAHGNQFPTSGMDGKRDEDLRRSRPPPTCRTSESQTLTDLSMNLLVGKVITDEEDEVSVDYQSKSNRAVMIQTLSTGHVLTIPKEIDTSVLAERCVARVMRP